MTGSTDDLKSSTKRILVLRDGVNPSFAYALLGFTILIWIALGISYMTRHDLDSPVVINCITHACLIDSNSWKVFAIPSMIFSIITFLCFRFSRKEIKN